jgi:ribosomal protein S8
LVEITDWHWYTKDGRVYVVGEVRNNTDKTKKFVKIVATFYDENNNPIAKKSGYIDDYHLLPGETGTFAIMKLADERYKRCGVYVETWGLVFLSE